MEDALEQQLGIAKVAPKVGRDLLEAARRPPGTLQRAADIGAPTPWYPPEGS
jgi:hypothetical protein